MFRTGNGQRIPGVTERQMREIDHIAMQEFGLGVFQMMENAGRSLALHVMEMLGASTHQRVRLQFLPEQGEMVGVAYAVRGICRIEGSRCISTSIASGMPCGIRR